MFARKGLLLTISDLFGAHDVLASKFRTKAIPVWDIAYTSFLMRNVDSDCIVIVNCRRRIFGLGNLKLDTCRNPNFLCDL